MKSWQLPQIGHHQVSYEAVTSLTRETFHSAEGMYFPTIGANWNGPLAPFNRHIHDTKYDEGELAATPNRASSGQLRGCNFTDA